MVNIEEENADELLEFVEKCTDFLHEHKDKLSIAVLNVNSISRKFHNIEFLLSKHQIKVLVINESKILSLIFKIFQIFLIQKKPSS